jgi:hypothetical protein
MVVVPETLAFGISGVHQEYPGYIDNAATGAKDYNEGTQDAARGVIFWKPVDSLSVKLQGIYNQSDFEGNGTITATADGHPTYGDYTIFSPTGRDRRARRSSGLRASITTSAR